MEEIIEYLEKKIQACDELGGMNLEKFAFVVTLKKARKIAMNYTPCCVSEAEQLFAFFMWFRENSEKHIGKSIEDMIDVYIKSK
jgi:hypothetical protein